MRRQLAALRSRAARAGAGDGGSMAVEFVFVVPALLILMLFLVYAGSVVQAHGQVSGAARDAARAASLAPSLGSAEDAADSAVSQDVPGCPVSPGGNPALSGWPQTATAQSADVDVAISCPVNMSVLGFGFPSLTVHAFAAAPLDTYTPRTAQ